MMLSDNVNSKQAIVSPIFNKDFEKNNSSSSHESVHKPRSSSSFKRVSFGDVSGAAVQTYIYESVPIVEEEFARSHSPAPPPTKVYVEIVDSQTPHHIQPPATDTSISSWDSNLASSVDLHNSGVYTSTPVLQQKTNKMEYDHDNPFRPDGNLSHEVEPIVEIYKHRPYPTNDELDGMMGTTIKNAVNQNTSSSPPTSPRSPPLPSSKNVVDGGASSPNKKNDIKNGTKSTTNDVVKPTDIKFNTYDGLTNYNNQQQQQVADVQHRVLASPKAGTVQVVHVDEKKKRCACCVIQ